MPSWSVTGCEASTSRLSGTGWRIGDGWSEWDTRAAVGCRSATARVDQDAGALAVAREFSTASGTVSTVSGGGPVRNASACSSTESFDGVP